MGLGDLFHCSGGMGVISFFFLVSVCDFIFMKKKLSYSSLNLLILGRVSRTGLPWVDPA